MTGDFVNSFQERIGRYEREDSMARGQLPASDPAHYLRGVQNVRERTNRWNADRLRSGVRRVAGISYGDTVPDPAQTIRLAPGADAVTLNREMRRARDANISRRREPKAQPRLDSLQGQKIVVPTQEAVPPVSLASPEMEAPQVDLDILHRLLQTPSRVLSKSSSPFARLSPAAGSDAAPVGTVSAPLYAPSPPDRQTSRLPPVRGRLLPMSLARGSRLRPQEGLRATKLPAISDSANLWRQYGAFGRSNTDLHGFKIYQQLLGGGDVRRHRRGFPTPSLAHVSGDGVPLPSPQEESAKGNLPVPSFPITQLLTAAEQKTPRVDYISINIALPRTDQSRPETPSNAAFGVAGQSFVPPPSPATLRPEEEEEEEEGED